MGEDARSRGRMLALSLGGLAILLGVAAVVLDLFQGEGISAGPLVVAAVGLVVVASARKRSTAP